MVLGHVLHALQAEQVEVGLVPVPHQVAELEPGMNARIGPDTGDGEDVGLSGLQLVGDPFAEVGDELGGRDGGGEGGEAGEDGLEEKHDWRWVFATAGSTNVALDRSISSRRGEVWKEVAQEKRASCGGQA